MTFRFNTRAGVILCTARLVNSPSSIFTKMAVDTGATITMVPKEHALAVGLNPHKSKRHIEIATANGKVVMPIVTMPIFECLGARVYNIDVICHNLP